MHAPENAITRYQQIQGELRLVSSDYVMQMGDEQDWTRMVETEARQRRGEFKVKLVAAIPNKVRDVFMNRYLNEGGDPIGDHYGVNF